MEIEYIPLRMRLIIDGDQLQFSQPWKTPRLTLTEKMVSHHTLFCYVDQLDCFIGGSMVCNRACINTYCWGCGNFLMVINGSFHSNDERHVLACCLLANSKLLLDSVITTVDQHLVISMLINGCFCHHHYRVLSQPGDQRPKISRWSTANNWPLINGQKM